MNFFRRLLQWIGRGLVEAWNGVGYWNEMRQVDEFGNKPEPVAGTEVSILGVRIKIKNS